ncbi:MAG: hypothetical protein JRN39_05920 [Nitrososphaerota archaeon]|nr:hypothetical protein [Nitrososphaerota archaeon]MDG6939918.1 hypothetical protein [Nitrososphaerota archaeon]
MNRRGVQLVEEAILLVIAVIMVSLLVGGIQEVLTKAGGLTNNVWGGISGSLNSLFGFLWHW